MKNFADIQIGSQSRNKTIQKERKEHYGFDTETYNGKLHLITYAGMQKEGYLFIDLDNPDFDIFDILRFMTQKKFQTSLNWFYNLDYDVRAILRWMDEDHISNLYQQKETDIGDYHITFLSKKFFTIQKGKRVFSFYDISQFYPGGLDKNAKKYLKDTKKNDINAKILGVNKEYWYNNLVAVKKYCIHDSLLTGKLGELLYSNLWRVLRFNPKKPFSAGSISQEFFINNCDFIPTINGIPSDILRIHQNNYRGGRIEVLKRGYFENIYSFDIKSAYPAEMINLLDYSAGIWHKTTDFDDNMHGIYQVKFNWFNPDLGLIAFNADNKTVYPNGENCVSWMNEKEICLLNDNSKFGDFEIISGYAFHPYREIYPYRKLIKEFYELKENAKDINERMLYKLFINSIYGKTAQAIYDKDDKCYKTGKLYNPVYSCRITANTRIKLVKHALPISKRVIGFSTDSIQTLSDNIVCGKNLGDFEKEYCAKEGVILMAGIRYLDDMQKMRGFNSKDEEGKTLLLRELLLKNLEKSLIPIYIEKPITIFQGLKYKKFKKDDINIFKGEDRLLDINGDNRRLWMDDFKNAEDCLSRNIDSIPFFIENGINQ